MPQDFHSLSCRNSSISVAQSTSRQLYSYLFIVSPHCAPFPPFSQRVAWEVVFQGLDPSSAIEGIRAEAPLIAYLAVVTTALTNWLQALGQRSVPAERAAIIYAMDPVYAAGFAYLVLGETLGPTGLAGAATITGAALWSQGQQANEGGDSGGETENVLQKPNSLDMPEEGTPDDGRDESGT